MNNEIKVFIKLENNSYQEISYKELQKRRKIDTLYKNKKFIKLDKTLLEVSKQDYIKFDKDYQREKYVDRLKKKYKVISLDKEYANKVILKDIIQNTEENMVDIINRKDEIIKLEKALLQLNKDEYELIKALFFEGKTITEYALNTRNTIYYNLQ